MEKTKFHNNVFFPMPMTIVGSIINNKPNYMAVGWVSRINANPPMLVIGINNRHFTIKGILETNEFSVNIPSENILTETDYVGIESGANVDKSEVFKSFFGTLKNAPLIDECNVNLACKVVSIQKLPTNTLIVGEIVEAFCNPEFAENRNISFDKMEAFFLTMPNNKYWSFGKETGEAWKIGKNYKPQKTTK